MSNIIRPQLKYKIDMRKIILTILHRWMFLITVVLQAGIAAAVISVLQPPVYEASTAIQVDSIIPFFPNLLAFDPSTFLVSYTVYQKTYALLNMVLASIIITNKTNNESAVVQRTTLPGSPINTRIKLNIVMGGIA